jgi:hypothetical protein
MKGLAARLGLPMQRVRDLTILKGDHECPPDEALQSQDDLSFTIKHSVALHVSFQGCGPVPFDFPNKLKFSDFHGYVARYFLGRDPDAIILERGKKPIRAKESLKAGEVTVKFADPSDFMLHFTTKSSKDVRLLLPGNATWACARKTLAGIMECEEHLLGAWHGKKHLRPEDRLVLLQSSKVLLTGHSPFVWFRTPALGRTLSTRCRGPLTMDMARPALARCWDIDPARMEFSFRGRRLDPVEELVLLKTSEKFPIEVRILRLFTFEFGDETFEHALPDDMQVCAAQRTISEIIERPVERLATQADGPLELTRTMGTISSRRLKVISFARHFQLLLFHREPMAVWL